MDIENIDTDSLSLEQLRELALGTAVPPAEQPRDPQGRFVADPEPQPDPEPEPEGDPEPQEFVRVIDLGDGSGTQVFRGATPEELIDKLAEAQKNATRKIRTDNQTVKDLQARLEQLEKKPVSEMTQDERFVLAQKFMVDPVSAVAETLKANGLDPKKLKAATERIDQEEQVKHNVAVLGQWMTSHPEFVDTDSNGRKIGNFLQRFHGGVATLANIENAYNVLKADGLLQDKAPEVIPPVPPVRRTTTLSGRRSVTPAPPAPKDPYDMDMDELKRLANGGKAFGGW